MIKFFNLFFVFLQIILFYITPTFSFFLNGFNKRHMNLFMSENNYELAKEYYQFKKNLDPLALQPDTYFYEDNLKNCNLDDEVYIDFAKNYETNYRIFSNNWFKIKNHNKNNSFKLKLNKFADTINFNNTDIPDDLMKCSNNFNIPDKSWLSQGEYILPKIIPFYNQILNLFNRQPTEVDWRKTKYLTDIKDQGQCGSCWAFSSTSALESFLKKNKLKVDRLSEQELVDCSKENYGCNGGLMDLAFDYCIENNGLHSDENYPYNAKDNECLNGCTVDEIDSTIEKRNCTIGDKVKGSGNFSYSYTTPYSVNSLKESVIKNPVSIAINANTPVFRFYSEGVVEDLGDDIPDQINHAVLLVGYNYDKKGMYWIIQNSWGKDWGDNGFIKIRSKEGSGILSCQIYGVYPINKEDDDKN